VCTVPLRRSSSARDDSDHSAGQAFAASLIRPPSRMARRPHATGESLIELFLDMLAAERGASTNTLDAYRRDLADFSADLAKTGGTIAQADSQALRDHLGRLDKRGLATASVARRLSAIRQLYRFLYSEGHRA